VNRDDGTICLYSELNYNQIRVKAVKTYTFNIVVEPDEDRWHAYCPALHTQGAATWGLTRAEALKNIEEVLRLVMESMVEHDEPLPQSVRGEVEVTVEPRVAITV
jgi:predicted RNase H-like HicB family nuclease